MTGWVAIDFETANGLRASRCSVGLVRVKEGADACQASRLLIPDLRFACTHVVARSIWTGLLSYKLLALSDSLGIELPRHQHVGDDARLRPRVMLAALKWAPVLRQGHRHQADQVRGTDRHDDRRPGRNGNRPGVHELRPQVVAMISEAVRAQAAS